MRFICQKIPILLLIVLPFASFAQTAHLSNALGQINYSAKEIQFEFNNGFPQIKPGENLKWILRLEDPDRNFETIEINSEQQKSVLKVDPDGFTVRYAKLKSRGKEYQISLAIHFKKEASSFIIYPALKNDEKNLVAVEFEGPIIQGINVKLEDYKLLMPTGVGQEFIKTPNLDIVTNKDKPQNGLSWVSNKEGSNYKISSHYPSMNATMQWCAFSGKNNGLYLASHDGKHGSKQFAISYSRATQKFSFSFIHRFACHPGENYAVANLVIAPFSGSWHAAAKLYRTWFNTSVKLKEVPIWAKNASGWMLTILKQQNNEVMWDYHSLKEMIKISDERGLDIIGMFGWAHGGHDRFYPDYFPDTLMGGKQALIKALSDIRKAGKRSILYVNGQLMDQNGTTFWDSIGKSINIVAKDKSLDFQTWHKYSDAPPRKHGMACLSSDLWYNRMLQLAKEANAYGADGIIYDQLATAPPRFCYATDHNHKTPEVMYSVDKYYLLRKIDNTMKTINPDFIVMTEGLNDVLMNTISLFHGCETGVFVPKQTEIEAKYGKAAPSSIFPEMFKYTFPEMMTTTRNPAPVNNRLILNYATVYGFRQELESRYAADVRYLKENKIPVPEDYHNVISKPNLDLVRSQDPVAMKDYTKQIIDFQKENSDLLWHGKFIDDEKIVAGEDQVVAKAFENGNKLGVVAWNYSNQQQGFKLDVPGYVLENVTEPGLSVVNPKEPIAANSIRLYVWKKVQ